MKPRLSKNALVEAIGGLEMWARQCHAASLALVRTGLLSNKARVARGFHRHIMGQHSWVVIGNPYLRSAKILDPTLWSYEGAPPALVVYRHGNAEDYFPKGAGKIDLTALNLHARSMSRNAEVIRLDVGMNKEARDFLAHITPPRGMTFECWHALANAPIEGWPAKAIITAMAQHDRLKALVPIDVVGMLTDLNPGKLYW
jgi:hypothetical protein